jgi:hypothetical protein
MNERRKVRASDGDREVAAERLSEALTEGRLSMDEYDIRLGDAFKAVTHGELADLLDDLPGEQPRPAAAVRTEARPAPAGRLARMPRWLRVVWGIWTVKVSLNLAVWVMLSVGGGSPAYFWPMWLIVPPGLALLGLSAGTAYSRRGRPVEGGGRPTALGG